MILDEKINRWFSQHFSHLQKEVKTKIAIDGMSQYADDLLSICTESFLTKSPAQRQQMLDDDKIENYILFCCGFQIKSANSLFYNQFRKHKMSVRSGMVEFDNVPYVNEPQIEDSELSNSTNPVS